MRKLLGVLALGCAAELPPMDACKEFKIGDCQSMPVVAGFKLIGCVAYKPDWRTIRCTFLKADETAVLTLGSDNCASWRLIAVGEKK